MKRRTENRNALWLGLGLFAAGAAVGAGLFYFLDPRLGRGRRALAWARSSKLGRGAAVGVAKWGRHIYHHGQGLLAKGRHLFDREAPAEEVLIARVRSELGHTVPHAKEVEVVYLDGALLVSGDVTPPEKDAILSAVSGVRGVRKVENHLRIVEPPGEEDAAV